MRRVNPLFWSIYFIFLYLFLWYFLFVSLRSHLQDSSALNLDIRVQRQGLDSHASVASTIRQSQFSSILKR